MNKLFISFIILFVFNNLSISQIDPAEIDDLIKNGSEQLLVKENSRLMQEEFLYYADKIASRLLELNPTSCNYNYRKGFTTLYSKQDPENAKKYFQVAITNTNKNYDAFSKNELSAPHDAHFHYAECFHKLGEYDKALEQLNIFKEKTRDESELLEQINLKIQQVQNAKNAAGPNLQSQNLTEINTEYPDFAPLISLDGNLLFYTARRPWENGQTQKYHDRKYNFPPEDGYVVMNQNGKWLNPERLDICKPNFNEAGLAMSPNERSLILYSDSTGNGDLYFGQAGVRTFDPSEIKLDTSLNTEFWETHATFTADANTIYFTSDRDGGLGGRDIYMITKGTDGKWSQPKNLGSPVNSMYDEDGPFLSFDGKVLYFSSNGIRSYGGFDIFMSVLEPEGTWSMPVNMGAPFNTTYDDVFYSTTIDGKKAYLSSNREGGKGSLDIYTVDGVKSQNEIAVFKGIIKTSTSAPLPEDVALDFKLSCNDCQVKEQSMVLSPRLRDGVFYGNLEPCKTYHITLFNPNNTPAFHDETFVTQCNIPYQEVVREFIYDMDEKVIKPIEKPVQPIDTLVAEFKNFEFLNYFDYNKNKVAEQKAEISKIFKEMEEQIKKGRSGITINIYSSASTVPTKTYGSNEKLAQMRADNMMKELNNLINSNNILKGKVTVNVSKVVVDGPAYEKDSANKGKYRPYQYVGFKTE